MEIIKQYFKKYKEPILYVVFGGLTTLVNMISYFLETRLFSIDEITATVISWVLSVAFAYITNKIWVFESKRSDFGYLCREVASFFGCRLFSGALDVGMMYLFVTIFGFPDIFIKIMSNIVVVVLNYIFSKLFIFQKSSDRLS